MDYIITDNQLEVIREAAVFLEENRETFITPIQEEARQLAVKLRSIWRDAPSTDGF